MMLGSLVLLVLLIAALIYTVLMTVNTFRDACEAWSYDVASFSLFFFLTTLFSVLSVVFGYGIYLTVGDLIK